jgi:hypothetical protein
MLSRQRNALAIAAALTVTTITGGALVAVLSSQHPATSPASLRPHVITLPQAVAPQAPTPFVTAPAAPHEREEGDS